MHAVRLATLIALVALPVAAAAGPPPPVQIDCNDAVGIPGGIASVEVLLTREG